MNPVNLMNPVPPFRTGYDLKGQLPELSQTMNYVNIMNPMPGYDPKGQLPTYESYESYESYAGYDLKGKLPELPEAGTFDLEEVKKSTYFFS